MRSQRHTRYEWRGCGVDGDHVLTRELSSDEVRYPNAGSRFPVEPIRINMCTNIKSAPRSQAAQMTVIMEVCQLFSIVSIHIRDDRHEFVLSE
jgi:hypothetical protein